MEDFIPHGNGISCKKSVGKNIKFIYDEIFDTFLIKEYRDSDKKILVQYKDTEIWMSSSNIYNNRFPFVPDKKKLPYIAPVEYKFNVFDVVRNDKQNITITNRYYEDKFYGGTSKRIKFYDYRCNDCGFEKLHVSEGSLFYRRTGCPCCASSVVVEGINDIPTTDPWMIPYFSGGYDEAKQYSSHSGKRIVAVCPDCGKTKSVIIANIKRRGHISCSCGDGISYPEKFFISALEQLNIKYEYQKSFDWSNFYNPYKSKVIKCRYDFYIKDFNLLVETDGRWHKVDNTLSGQTKEESAFIDNKKTDVAKRNGFNVVRIDCDVSSKQYIANSIKNSELKKYVDISTIDYERCDLFACSNLKKVVISEYKKSDLPATMIAEKYGISASCVCQWLRSVGISSQERSSKHKSLRQGKPVKATYGENICKVYSSLVCLAINFEKDFGVKSSYPQMGKRLREGKLYKGVMIEYI